MAHRVKVLVAIVALFILTLGGFFALNRVSYAAFNDYAVIHVTRRSYDIHHIRLATTIIVIAMLWGGFVAWLFRQRQRP